MPRLPSNQDLWDFAVLLQRMHKNHLITRKCDPEPTRDYKGLLAQRRLAYLTGGLMDMAIKPGGDGHIDQWLDFRGDGDAYPPGRYPADVKAARFPKDLIVPVRDMQAIKRPTIMILAEVLNHDDPDPMQWDAELRAWEWSDELRKSEPKDYGYGIMNHWKPRQQCRDIFELMAKLDRNWRVA